MDETNGDSRTNAVTIAAIIVGGIVALACIIAFAAITIAFFSNPPW